MHTKPQKNALNFQTSSKAVLSVHVTISDCQTKQNQVSLGPLDTTGER